MVLWGQGWLLPFDISNLSNYWQCSWGESDCAEVCGTCNSELIGEALPLSLSPVAQQQAGRHLSGERCLCLAPQVGAGRLQRTPMSSPLPPVVRRAVAIHSHTPSESLLQWGLGIEGCLESQACSATACFAHLLPCCRMAAWAWPACRSLGFILIKSMSTGWGKELKARSAVSVCTGHSRERETEARGKDRAQPLLEAGLGSPGASAPWHTMAPTLKLPLLPLLTGFPYHINQNPIFSPLF